MFFLRADTNLKQPSFYRGYYFDNETGFYYLQSRYYDPNTGRFINADDTSVLQATQGDLLGANMFAYCYNNPIMNSDPNGNSPWFIIPFPGFIHILVQRYLSNIYKFAKEKVTTIPLGRIDLYDTITGEGWEIKPIGTSYVKALAQLSGYKVLMKGNLKYGRLLGTHSFIFGPLKIKIFSLPLGIIYYSFDLTAYGLLFLSAYKASA